MMGSEVVASRCGIHPRHGRVLVSMVSLCSNAFPENRNFKELSTCMFVCIYVHLVVHGVELRTIVRALVLAYIKHREKDS